jgi:hypothetical protein
LFEFRLRILEVGQASYLGIVEGFPQVMVHASDSSAAEADLVRALVDFLERLKDEETTRIQCDDFPTVRSIRLSLTPSAR